MMMTRNILITIIVIIMITMIYLTFAKTFLCFYPPNFDHDNDQWLAIYAVVATITFLKENLPEFVFFKTQGSFFGAQKCANFTKTQVFSCSFFF